MEICWACGYPIDVDESIEGHAQIHKDCLLEIHTNGRWDSIVETVQRRKLQYLTAVNNLDRRLINQEAALLASA